jgi:hypothetical protein
VPLPDRVIDPGPIAYADIELYGDPDLEHALSEEGLDPGTTSHRLIEIPLRTVLDTASMPWMRVGNSYVDPLKSGHKFPPIVVFPNQRGWLLLDGVNRTHAYVMLGTETVRAYELLRS